MTDTTANTSGTQDPAAIERDIRQTQERMSRTVDRIGDQLSIKNVVNALLDKADESNIDARMVLDTARRKPVALGLLAAGAIWLVSDNDAKFPTFGRKSDEGDSEAMRGKGRYAGSSDVHHRDYVSHMASIEQNPGEDAAAYQRRRDIARSNFFMVERRHEEDDSSFRQRLDEMTESFRRARHDWADSAGRATSSAGKAMSGAMGSAQSAISGAATSAQQTMRSATQSAQGLYSENPLVGGVIAAAIGAIAGLSVPLSETEQSALGEIGGKARDMIGDTAQQATDQLRAKKDQLVDQADEALRPDGTPTGRGPGQQGSQPAGAKPDQYGAQTGEKPPFILAQ